MFNLVSKFNPSGDQPQAIEKLVNGIKNGEKNQVLLGATGTGKTFTIANVIKEVNKPTLVLAHNKTLDNLPKKVKDKARGSKTYKKGKENQKKTNAAKVEIKRRGLHWNNAF